MRVLIIIAGLLALSLSVASAAEQERPRCENCGMFTDISATNVFATLKVEGKEAKHNFVCLECILEFNEREYEGEAELTALQILDYNTFGTKTPVMLDGMKAFYLFGTKALAGSMEPWIAAFKTKEAAVSAQKKLGGALLDFAEMWAKLTSDETEGGHEHGDKPAAGAAGAVYVCSCTGGCCDNIRLDQPGSCPQCGMELVLESEK